MGLFGRRKDAAVSRIMAGRERPVCGSGRTCGRSWLPRRYSGGHGRGTGANGSAERYDAFTRVVAGGGVRPYEMVSAGLRAVAKIS